MSTTKSFKYNPPGKGLANEGLSLTLFSLFTFHLPLLTYFQDHVNESYMMNLNFNPFPVLGTTRLGLRQVLDDDAPSILALRSDKKVMQYIDRPLAGSIQDALQLIQNIKEAQHQDEGITWAISYKDDHELIGTIGFWKIVKEHYRAEIGYMMHAVHQGKGLMQEALNAVLDYGFNQMNLHSVEANVNPSNSVSIKLLERNHFVHEGRFRENYYYNGKFLDTYTFSLLAPMKK